MYRYKTENPRWSLPATPNKIICNISLLKHLLNIIREKSTIDKKLARHLLLKKT
jgi:hypothetical protein